MDGTNKMVTDEQLAKAEEILNNIGIPTEEDRIKRIKTRDRGLIERAENSKVVLIEDNRQVLHD